MTGRDEITPSPPGRPPRRIVLKLRGRALLLSLGAALLSAIGLVLVTGLATSAWLFLIYPVLITTLLASLGFLALQLLRRL
ncbi:MAG TPA: hypothetical protein VKT32_04065 [Chthonomonadaceae bacterium]|nr:hypothetical protein [Chthonomonadaceae bacterium]